jgi:hypothetical protein
MLALQRNDSSATRNHDSRASDHGPARTNRANEKYPGPLSIFSMTRDGGVTWKKRPYKDARWKFVV